MMLLLTGMINDMVKVIIVIITIFKKSSIIFISIFLLLINITIMNASIIISTTIITINTTSFTSVIMFIMIMAKVIRINKLFSDEL